MIFVSVGTQKFQFNRLLKYIDELIDSGDFTESVFAQIGHSNYIPKNYEYKRFLAQQDFEQNIQKCSLFITHGGVGSINTGIKYHKKIIACPRQSSFKEHVDDHQLQITRKFDELGLLKQAMDVCDFKNIIKEVEHFIPKEVPIAKTSDNPISSAVFDFLGSL